MTHWALLWTRKNNQPSKIIKKWNGNRTSARRSEPKAQYINYTVCLLHCQKCPAFFRLCCVIRTFLAGSRHYMVKKMFPIFFDYFNIVYFFKKLWGFLFELIDFALEESAVGERTVTLVLFQFLEIGTKHAQISGAHYDVIMLVRNILISSVLVQSLIFNQSKVFLAAKGFLSN